MKKEDFLTWLALVSALVIGATLVVRGFLQGL